MGQPLDGHGQEQAMSARTLLLVSVLAVAACGPESGHSRANLPLSPSPIVGVPEATTLVPYTYDHYPPFICLATTGYAVSVSSDLDNDGFLNCDNAPGPFCDALCPIPQIAPRQTSNLGVVHVDVWEDGYSPPTEAQVCARQFGSATYICTNAETASGGPYATITFDYGDLRELLVLGNTYSLYVIVRNGQNDGLIGIRIYWNV